MCIYIYIHVINSWTSKNIKQVRFPDLKIWLVATKNDGCGFPWYIVMVVTATGWGRKPIYS